MVKIGTKGERKEDGKRKACSINRMHLVYHHHHPIDTCPFSPSLSARDIWQG